MKQPLPYTSTAKAIKGYSDSLIAKSEKSDCVVRAIASTFDVEYDVAHKFVAETFHRKPKRGTFMTANKLVKLSDSGFTLNSKKIYLIGDRKNASMTGSLKYPVMVAGKIQMRDMTVGKFSQLNPVGTFFILVRGHAFTLKDGHIIGNPNDATRLKRPIRSAFEIK